MIADAWLGWVADALLRGRPVQEVVDTLVEEGLPVDEALPLVEQIQQSPGQRAAQIAIHHAARAARLRRSALLPVRDVARIPLDVELYANGFHGPLTPVVLTGATRHWPALEWTWAELRERFGALPAQAIGERDRPHPDIDFEDRKIDMPLSELIDAISVPHAPLYTTARNHNGTTGLAALLADIRPIPGLIANIERSVDFWIGPEGAHTALHYDRNTTLMCPVLGRKHVRFVPPEEVVTESEHAYWADPIDYEDVAHLEVVVEPGDVLSIPAGWWHEVTTLDQSIAVSLADLTLPGRSHRWYRTDT